MRCRRGASSSSGEVPCADVYPTITVALTVIGPGSAHMPLMIRMLLRTAVVVPVTAYVLAPALTRPTSALVSCRH